MKTIGLLKVAMLFVIAAAIPSALANDTDDSNTDSGRPRASGAVFTLSNSKAGNEVLAFHRNADGRLQRAGTFPTGGSGSSDGLGSQGAIILSADGELLFAVDAGSNEISSFAVHGTRLRRVSHVSSGGERPISLTVHNDLLYVLNAGGDGNITGFSVSDEGMLTPLRDSTRPLSGRTVQPAQLQFTPDGERLIVAEKATNQIDIYELNDDGHADGPHVKASSGQTPFGFEFGRRGVLVVSEAFGGAPGAGAVSSYRLNDTADLAVVSASVPNLQAAPCWVEITVDGRTAFITNTGSGTISAYHINRDGSLELLNNNGIAASTGEGSMPIDMALSRHSRFLYALDSGTAAISAFRVLPGGGLDRLRGVSNLPPHAVGLAAR